MALQNQKALYEIELRRTGQGAQQAVADFKLVQSEAARTNATLATGAAASVTSFNALTNTTKSTVAGLKAMQGTATLLGMQAFPQATTAALTLQTAFSGVRSAAAAAVKGWVS